MCMPNSSNYCKENLFFRTVGRDTKKFISEVIERDLVSFLCTFKAAKAVSADRRSNASKLLIIAGLKVTSYSSTNRC